MKLASIFFTASAVNLQSLCILCSYVQNHKKILRFAQNDRLHEFVILGEAKNLKIVLSNNIDIDPMLTLFANLSS